MVTADDFNHLLRCSATAEGLVEARSDEIVGQQPDGPQRIEGGPYPGRILTCVPFDWNQRDYLRYTFTYRWYYHGSGYYDVEPIPGADQPTYVVPARDVGRDIACRVSGDGYMSRYDTWTWVTWEPLTIRLKPDDDAIAPGESNGYTLEISNPNPASLTLNELSATVPFPYVEGSSTGLSTADPARRGLRPHLERRVPDPGRGRGEPAFPGGRDVGRRGLRHCAGRDVGGRARQRA